MCVEPRRAPVRRALLLLILALVSGCGTMRYGVPPRVERLDELQPGLSTTADVLLRLGEPRGRGAVRLTRAEPMRDVFLYEYVEADASGKARLKMLLVLIRADRYDGHLWFSDELLLRPAAAGGGGGP